MSVALYFICWCSLRDVLCVVCVVCTAERVPIVGRGDRPDWTGLDWDVASVVALCCASSPLSLSLSFSLFLPHTLLLLHPTLCAFTSSPSSRSLILICPPTLAYKHTHTYTHTLMQVIPSLTWQLHPYTTLGHIHNFTLLMLIRTLTHTHSCTHSRILAHTSLFLPHVLHPTLRHICRLWDCHL